MKRLLCAALTLCLTLGLLAGCESSGEDKGKNVPMGRYIETQLGTLEGAERVRGTFLQEDGDLVTYGINRAQQWVKRYEISQSGEIREQNIHWLSALMAGGSSIAGICETPGGEVFAVYKDQQSKPHLARAEGDAPQDISIPDWEKEEDADGESGGVSSSGMSGMSTGTVSASGSGVIFEAQGGLSVGGATRTPPTGLYVLDNGDYLIFYGAEGASRYAAADGALIREYPCTAYAGTAAVYGNRLLAFDQNYSTLWLYDLDTGEQSECSFEGLDYTILPNLDGEGIYLAGSGGIFRQAEGGTLWEKLVDGELTSLSMPDLTMGSVVSEPGGGYWALLSGEENMEVMRYTYSADTPTNPDTELTIASLADNATIRQAIGEFQRRNTSVKVNFQILLDEGSAATAEDVIRALNTELLNGKGPDLLVLDGLPTDSYIEKGVLSDLGALEEKLEAQGLMANLMGAYRTEQGLFALPCRFTLPVMMGKAEDVAAIRSLADLAAAVEERQGGEPPFLKAPDTLWGEEGAAPLYMDLFAPARQGAGVDESGLAAFFREAERLDAVLKEHTPQSGNAVAIITVVSSGNGSAEALDMGSFTLRKGEALFHIQGLAGVQGLNQICSNLDKAKGWALDSLFGEGTFTPKGAVGVVSTSGQKELAESFVELLLSPTVQDKYLGDGFPVVRGSLDKCVNKVLDGADDMGFLALCDTLTVPLLTDQVVTDAVLGQLQDLLAGKTTPEEAAAQVREKTEIYLSE